MLKKGLFKRPGNTLEKTQGDNVLPVPNVPETLFTTCKGCKAAVLTNELAQNLYVCPRCGYHGVIGARVRLMRLADDGSFEEWDAEISSADPLLFPGYADKAAEARVLSGEKEAVVGGMMRIQGCPCAAFAMDSRFMMGSMGGAAGEKITRLFEKAAQMDLTVIAFTLSGGARMQEGILSLMQMAKTSGAVKYHSDAGNLYVSVLCNPTAGGVTASFAMESDIALAEPGALICFAGPRVIEQTLRQKLPKGFQSAEFLMDKGFIDAVVPRAQQKDYLGILLKLHAKEHKNASV
ncbi:MAG: acetyl-CoA carboxylase, carboxyltransferase subunit beta [Eubacteriales bacterium]|jgi:acetyl-CoA carboxylase carboxyl transferase subunit beta|nr:acetyl-CoA carboxylase, carboxyltransferase subunit beta [Eubacteriales bacterium]MDD4105813.1 acetyl-CoA carboxylase, carboxyltransferase subunit beta [Eubacteriales bacterium]MDD4711060.1 acetyl-CoA carboxylase, carboxyltransferase subunit beta [Eubacteriales bacterium]NLO14680.1 acetyl-CoA carboxylase, carboxyltransferase subunit beta [Clostridiales bacterium]